MYGGLARVSYSSILVKHHSKRAPAIVSVSNRGYRKHFKRMAANWMILSRAGGGGVPIEELASECSFITIT